MVKEHFYDRDGKSCFRSSFFTIENLGKTADKAFSLAKEGTRMVVDGYVRSEEGKIIIRSYTIYPDISLEAASYRDGIKRAIKTLDASRNVHTAKRVLQTILEDTC
jgi:hypothetical protein